MSEYFERINKVTQIGIAVTSLEPGTMTYGLIDFANRMSRDRLDVDISLYVEDIRTPPSSINVPVYQYRNMYGLRGSLVSTCIKTTKYILSVPDTCKKYFYVWNMDEYLTLPNIEEAVSLYNNDRLTIICRSEEYAKIVGKSFNVEPLVCESFDHPDFLNIIENRS